VDATTADEGPSTIPRQQAQSDPPRRAAGSRLHEF
jgi:hypothetical protein